jgi:hypothetical protein
MYLPYSFKNIFGLWNSSVALQPCPSGHIPADKKASPKLLRQLILFAECYMKW